MIVIDTIDKALKCLSQGYLLAKLTMDYSGMTKKCLVAGVLMGFSEGDWWYTLVRNDGGEACGLIPRKLFVELYQNYYIEKTTTTANGEVYFSLNGACSIQEAARYQHKVDCWSETTSRPTKINADSKIC